MSSSGDKMTPSPAEMRTTPKRAKSQTKADDDANKERLPQRHRSREHQQVPTAATPTRATNLRLRAWVDDADNERLPLHHRILTCLGGRRRQRTATSAPSHPYVPGWTTLTQSSYLHAIASANAQGSVSQIKKTVHENISQIIHTKIFLNIKPSPSSRTSAAEGDNQY